MSMRDYGSPTDVYGVCVALYPAQEAVVKGWPRVLNGSIYLSQCHL